MKNVGMKKKGSKWGNRKRDGVKSKREFKREREIVCANVK